MPKLENSNATFWVIFKHCEDGATARSETYKKTKVGKTHSKT